MSERATPEASRDYTRIAGRDCTCPPDDWEGPCERRYALTDCRMARITRERDEAREELAGFNGEWGIAEVGARNPRVMEYMKHWESRAERAEAALAEAERQRERLKGHADKLADYITDEYCSGVNCESCALIDAYRADKGE